MLTPKATPPRLLTFAAPPAGTFRSAVRLIEGATEAEQAARTQLQPRLVQRTPIALDFRGIEVCTQSFLHALLFETLRLAWALQVPVYVENADPVVVSGLKLVEAYALSH